MQPIRTRPHHPSPKPLLGKDLRPQGPPNLAGESLLVLYWLAFCLYETVFASTTISGFFYPFYLAFLAVVLATLFTRGIRLWSPAILLYVALLLAVAAGFVGFQEPIDFGPIQRVVAYLLGLIATVLVQSRRGLHLLTTGVVLTAVAVASWVVSQAFLGGFAYRGNIETDPNVAAFYLAPGAITAVALLRFALLSRASFLLLVGSALASLITLYASLLLASRGMAIALVLALIMLLLHGIRTDARRLGFILVLLALAGGAFLLPGGQGLVERFTSERVESGGSRIPIWGTTLRSYSESSPQHLLLGHGMDASKRVVQNASGSLTSTHNAYLQWLYEFGFVGLTLFLALHAVVFQRGRSLREPWGAMAVGVMTFLLAACLTVNATDGFLYWVALAFVISIATFAPSVTGTQPLRNMNQGVRHAPR